MQTPRTAAAGGITLVLPAHNEAATVAAVIARTPDTVAGLPVACVVVDDGSTDATAGRARDAGATVVCHPSRRGLGAAVRTGLRHAVDHGARVIAFCDADGEYAPEELATLVRPVLRGDADYVVGSRFAGTIRRMHPHRRTGNHVLTWALRRLAGAPISDGQSGYRALSADAADAAEIIHDYNYAQVLTLNLLRQGFRYAEVPITYGFREHGRSFVQLHHYLRAVVPAVWRELATPRAHTSAGVGSTITATAGDHLPGGLRRPASGVRQAGARPRTDAASARSLTARWRPPRMRPRPPGPRR